jgi:hypothetical protein
MYQICPGNPQFEFSTPLFKQVLIKLENNKKYIITNPSKGKQEKYIQKLNVPSRGKMLQINYQDVINGGSLTYQTTNTRDSAMQFYKRSYDVIDTNNQIIINPLIHSSENPFIKDSKVSMSAAAGSAVFYTLDGSFPTLESRQYLEPFIIDKSATIKAFAIHNGKASKTAIARIHQLPHPEWKVNLKSIYNKQYTAGGDAGIIDGIFGNIDWRKGGWQGFQAQDFEVIIDLTSEKEIKSISANFLQDSRSWILMPKIVIYEYSLDGEKFSPLAELKNELAANENTVVTKSFVKEFAPTKVRYVKVKAINFGKLPLWHQGFGGDAFIFIDEISIN